MITVGWTIYRDRFWDHLVRFCGKECTDTDTTMAVIWNMYNRCPVMAVPSGRATSGVPTGLQIIGRPQDDPTVFKIARAFEKERPWLDSAERRPNLDY